MVKECLNKVRATKPLVHNITNYVTVNDVANVLLAINASPIMADDSEEVEEITSICDALNINIGTLNRNTIPSMVLAGKKANELNHPVVLDPVGAGASKLRSATAINLIKEIKFDVIKGNISEIKTLALGCSNTRGVDANIDDCVTEQNLDQTIKFLREFAKDTNSIIAVTGTIDIVVSSDDCYIIRNGRKEMSQITGTGCQLSALISAFVVANKNNKILATVAALCVMGLAGQIGYENMNEQDGNSTYRNRIIDAIYQMTPEALELGANYEKR